MNVIVYILVNENVIYFSVLFINAQSIAIVFTGLPSDIDILAPNFRDIRPHRNYNLFDEVIRQFNKLNESEKIK